MHFEQHHSQNILSVSATLLQRERKNENKIALRTASQSKNSLVSLKRLCVFDLKPVFGETAVSYRLRTGGERE